MWRPASERIRSAESMRRALLGSTGSMRSLLAIALLGLPLAFVSNGPIDSAPAPPMPLISTGVPSFASGGTAHFGNDHDPSTYWRSGDAPVTPSSPAWLALDLGGVAASSRARVLVTWFSELPNYAPGEPFNQYFHPESTTGYHSGYDEPGDYEIQADRAGPGSPPIEGWTTLVDVKGNHFHSRSHVVDMTGYNWLRFYCTSSDSSVERSVLLQELEVRDASQGTNDEWLFLGDSITDGALKHSTVRDFGDLVGEVRGDAPAFEGAGMGNWTTDDILTQMNGATYAEQWIAQFPGRYVAIAFGTNDAAGRVPPARFYENYRRLVEIVQANGKIAVIPTIPYSADDAARRRQRIPLYNARLDELFSAGLPVVHGPDLFTHFATRRSQLDQEGLHPTAEGFAAIRQLWADAALGNVYGLRAAVSPSPRPAFDLTPMLARSPLWLSDAIEAIGLFPIFLLLVLVALAGWRTAANRRGRS